MDTTLDRTLLDQLLLRHQVEQFYNAEAEMLDSRQFAAWLDILTEDLRYWMPLTINKEHGQWGEEHTREGRDLNWFDEGKFELEQRVRQIETGLHWAEEPVSRTSHMFSNLQVTDNGMALSTRCRFLIYRNRTETQTDFFVGKRNDTLRRDGTGFKIAAREIFLDQNVLLAKNLTLFF